MWSRAASVCDRRWQGRRWRSCGPHSRLCRCWGRAARGERGEARRRGIRRFRLRTTCTIRCPARRNAPIRSMHWRTPRQEHDATGSGGVRLTRSKRLHVYRSRERAVQIPHCSMRFNTASSHGVPGLGRRIVCYRSHRSTISAPMPALCSPLLRSPAWWRACRKACRHSHFSLCWIRCRPTTCRDLVTARQVSCARSSQRTDVQARPRKASAYCTALTASPHAPSPWRPNATAHVRRRTLRRPARWTPRRSRR